MGLDIQGVRRAFEGIGDRFGRSFPSTRGEGATARETPREQPPKSRGGASGGRERAAAARLASQQIPGVRVQCAESRGFSGALSQGSRSMPKSVPPRFSAANGFSGSSLERTGVECHLGEVQAHAGRTLTKVSP